MNDGDALRGCFQQATMSRAVLWLMEMISSCRRARTLAMTRPKNIRFQSYFLEMWNAARS